MLFYLYLNNNINKMAEVKRTYYTSGELESEWFEINGKMYGEYKQYYENGIIHIICNYYNNILNGEDKQYYDNGQLCKKIIYVNGKWSVYMLL
jgi:antitoxin component YwqK of YwqJK toxin-antitoxin module